MEKSSIFIYFFAFIVLSVFSLNNFFKINLFSYFANLPKKEVTTEIILGGDIMLGRTVMSTSLSKNDPTYPFQKIASFLQTADLVFVNLENPFVTNCPPHSEGLIFCADPKMVESLTFANVGAVTLANNHTRNYGQAGLDETISLLASKDILATNSNLATTNINGLTFGLLGFNFLDIKPAESDYSLIQVSSKKVDVLIISIHWGNEYQAHPSQNQKEIAQRVITSGADILVGHHPHWVEDIEYIDNKPVYYSLGNFVFDQMWSESTRKGLLVRLTFNQKGVIINEEKFPIYMQNWAQPELVN